MKIVRAFLKGKLADAKASWSRKIAEKIHEMNTTPKTAWKAAYELMAGLLGHSKKHITVSLQMEDGRRATNGKENLSVAAPHFHKQFNMQRPRWADAASLIAKREQFDPLDNDLTFSEFKKATMKLKNGKAPGVTGVPPITFKLLGRKNLQTIYST